jgi:SNF2 family DNA or RNA helicase
MKLLPHQIDGVKWLLKRERDTEISGGLLCDEMGLGKTIQMIVLMRKNKVNKTLIVVPKSIVGQWISEIKKFTGSFFSVCEYDGPKRKFDETCDICVCPYSVVRDLIDIQWDRIILDEGHEIRNQKSLVYKNVISLKSTTKWILTGTPIFNKMKDFVTLCKFIGLDRKYVQCYFDETKDKYILRRLKTDMSPITFHNVELEMYESERELYEQVYDSFGEFEILEWILRCRQVCAWPQTYYDGIYKKYGGDLLEWKGSTAKMDTLIAMIRSHPTEKSIVFTQFIKESEEIKRRLELIGRSVFVMNGNTENRDELVNDFNTSKEGSVFLIQVKTGGVGLNLQEATRVYLMQPSWNPATELQAIARSHRSGQTKHVIVKKLVYSDCDAVDNEMTELQTKKTKICEKVVGKSSVSLPELKKVSNFLIKLGKGSNETGDSENDDRDS